MIRYRLTCRKGHEFEGWFASGAAYDRQAKQGRLTCPTCGISKVSKTLMAPSIAKSARSKRAKGSEAANSDKSSEATREPASRSASEPASKNAPAPTRPDTQRVAAHRELAAAMRTLKAEIEAKSEYVGQRFSEEARKIHYEETPARGIYGEATADEAKALSEEGIEFFPLPTLPEDHN
jgi:hypothetical protein